MQKVLIPSLRQSITDARYEKVMRRPWSLWFDDMADAEICRPRTIYLPRIHPAGYKAAVPMIPPAPSASISPALPIGRGRNTNLFR